MGDDPSEMILVVDDDKRLLDSLLRTHRRVYKMVAAEGGEEALQILRDQGPFAVIVSDCQMPGMDGITFLSRAAEEHPESIRVMLTGNADLRSAVSAVNDGQVFRFMTKPCPPEDFQRGVDAALEQYRLIQAEKLLLEGTVRGTVQVLSEVLAMANPVAFGRAERIKHYVSEVAGRLRIPDPWKLETAALLSQVGLISVPQNVMQKTVAGESLSAEERKMVDRHPEVGRELLGRIPRLEEVAAIIAAQAQPPFAGKEGEEAGDGLALERGILQVVLLFDDLVSGGDDVCSAVDHLSRKVGAAGKKILAALKDVQPPDVGTTLASLPVSELRVGMILNQDVLTKEGSLLIASGHRISRGMLERLQNYAELGGISEPIEVHVSQKTREPAATSPAC